MYNCTQMFTPAGFGMFFQAAVLPALELCFLCVRKFPGNLVCFQKVFLILLAFCFELGSCYNAPLLALNSWVQAIKQLLPSS